MEDIPATWPPEPPPVLPLFALPTVWLFPGVILPLHVFEERYVQLIEDHLDGQGRMVLGTFQDPEADAKGSPPIHPIAGLGEIGRHDRLPDGRYNILLVGLKRVRVEEVESDRLYRKVRVESADEISVDPEHEAGLRKRLIRAILERTPMREQEEAAEQGQRLTQVLPQVTISHLADFLTLRIPLPPDALNALYSELDEERRAEAALAEHARRPYVDPPDAGS